MEPLIINPGLCIACRACVDECPRRLFELALEPDAKPQLRFLDPERCLHCGHCAALCPTGAIAPGPDARFRLVSELPASPVADLLWRKRSVRLFRVDRPIERPTLDDLLAVAEQAPVASNNRHRSYVVLASRQQVVDLADRIIAAYRRVLWAADHLVLPVLRLLHLPARHELAKGAESIRRLVANHQKGLDPLFRQSPCVICIADQAKGRFPIDNTVSAATYLMLRAKDLGIDSLQVGYAQRYGSKLDRWLHLVPDSHIQTVIALGYGVHAYRRIVGHPKAPVTILD